MTYGIYHFFHDCNYETFLNLKNISFLNVLFLEFVIWASKQNMENMIST